MKVEYTMVGIIPEHEVDGRVSMHEVGKVFRDGL